MIRVLRGTIVTLETAVVKLETEATNTSQPSPQFWQQFLRKFRLFLPSSWANNISDTLLTAVLAIIAVGILGTVFIIYTANSDKVVAVQPIVQVSPLQPVPTNLPQPVTSPAEIPLGLPIPNIIEAAPTSTPTELVIIEPEATPAPIVVLTPEQTLIAAVEKQIGQIKILPGRQKEGLRSAAELIKSVAPNFRSSALTIKITDDWNALAEIQQKQLATDILKLSQELNFIHLEIIDSQGKLIARSPVVGKEVLIFRLNHDMQK
jgi:hypothetical protein